MKKFDVLIIGGGPAGIVTAATAMKQYKSKSIAIVQKEKTSLVPCGIPYIFHLLGKVEKNQMKRDFLNDEGENLFVNTVTAIVPEQKYIEFADGNRLGYEKLVLATGSRSASPAFLKLHRFKSGVEIVPKNHTGIQKLKIETDAARKIIILGSGFTAVEMAEQLAQNPGKEIHLVYCGSNCLYRSFSPAFAEKIDEVLAGTQLTLHPSSQISDITDNDGVATGIILSDGTEIKGDLIIAAMGFVPNTEITVDSGIKLSESGHIAVDNYLRTNIKDIYAAGDCAQSTGFITGRTDNIMLASTAAAEARVLGHNLYKIRIKRDFPGTLSVFATELNGTVFASAGVLEQDAKKAEIDYVTGYFEDIDRHPGCIPGAGKVVLKLVVMPEDGQIIGGELYGQKSSAEIINTIALAIQKHVTVYELVSFQMGTHPLLNTAPTKSVLIKAAEDALNKIIKQD